MKQPTSVYLGFVTVMLICLVLFYFSIKKQQTPTIPPTAVLKSNSTTFVDRNDGLITVQIQKLGIQFTYPAAWGKNITLNETPLYAEQTPFISISTPNNGANIGILLFSKKGTGLSTSDEKFWHTIHCPTNDEFFPGNYLSSVADETDSCRQLTKLSVEKFGVHYYPEASGSDFMQQITGGFEHPKFFGYQVITVIKTNEIIAWPKDLCSECNAEDAKKATLLYNQAFKKIQAGTIPDFMKQQINGLRSVANTIQAL